MEMHQLRYFLAAARSLNFTRAAETCKVSQPALTTAIKKLEAHLGSPLFRRDGHQLQLSEFGRRMQPNLGRIVEQTEMAETVAEGFRLLKQEPIRLGVMSTIGPARLSRFLANFGQEYPGVEVAVSERPLTELVSKLRADELDLAILNALDGVSEGLRLDTLYKERYLVLLPPEHALKERNSVTLQDLSDQPYVDRLACEMREMVMGVCETRGIKLYARFRSEREDWVQAMVMANMGFAFVPEYSITHSESVRRPLIEPTVERKQSVSPASQADDTRRQSRPLFARHAHIAGRARSQICEHCAACLHWISPSHHRADLPRHEFQVPVAQVLGLRVFARRHRF